MVKGPESLPSSSVSYGEQLQTSSLVQDLSNGEQEAPSTRFDPDGFKPASD